MPKKKKPTTETDNSNKPWVSNYPPLKQWLDEHNARCMWQVPSNPDRGDDPDWAPGAYIECYLINMHPVVVVVRSNQMGWDIYTTASTPLIDATLMDAEARLGLPERPPCGGHVQRSNMPCNRPKGHHGDCSV